MIGGVTKIYFRHLSFEHLGDENIFRHVSDKWGDEIYFRHLSFDHLGDENTFRHVSDRLGDEICFRH